MGIQVSCIHCILLYRAILSEILKICCQLVNTLFIKHSNWGKMTAVIVYVDDIVVIGNDLEEIEKLKLKERLANLYEKKDLGNFIISGNWSCSIKRRIVILQKNILDLLKETRMSGCRPFDTPVEVGDKLDELIVSQ